MPIGALGQLNAGVQEVSVADSKRLGRWRAGLGVVSAFFAIIACVGLTGDVSRVRLAGDVSGFLNAVLKAVIISTAMPIIFSGWWASMITASCLCRGNITDVITKVDSTDPADGPAWEENVVRSALALVESMETLSRGWSWGLLGLGGFLGLNGLGWFINVMNPEWTDGMYAMQGNAPATTRNICLIWAAFCAFLPLLLAMDIATTSSRYDLLIMDKLNKARIEHGVAHKTQREAHLAHRVAREARELLLVP